jgi:hypothetical protein
MSQKSNVVSGMGVALSLVQTLVASVRKAGGTDEDVHRLATPDANGVWDKIATLVVQAGKRGVFTLVVDYGRGLQDSIDAGKYDHSHPQISSGNFPPNQDEVGEKHVQFVMYDFGRDILEAVITARMRKDGKRPATLRELLAFGENHPELQRQFPIVALNAVCVGDNGGLLVAYLDNGRVGRTLGLQRFRSSWGSTCRFLAVSK